MADYCLWTCVAFGGAFIVNGFIEWTVHRFIMHRPWSLLLYAYTTHALGHHDTFGSEETYVAVTPEMQKEHGGFCWKEYTLLPGLCFLLYGSIHFLTEKPILPGAMLAAVLGLLMYDFLHYSFHVQRNSWFQRTWFFRFLKEHHRLHHADMTKNFNVYFFPVADFVMGTLKSQRHRV